ncbi:MAG: hypothetical protein QXD23_00565 [Candidatus Micrarchaeaceae archaeon]
MDLWEAYTRERLELNFGSQQLLLNTGDRHNSSLIQYLDRSIELKTNKVLFKSYSYESRYIRSIDITFDLLVTFYDVNTSSIFAFRQSKEFTNKELSKIIQEVKKLRSNNIECRIIGLQNTHLGLVHGITQMKEKIQCNLAELDIFGKEKRNILIDTKTGMSYNILMENRVYRPGELLNNQLYDDFEKTTANLVF